jgi:hypothetical protein
VTKNANRKIENFWKNRKKWNKKIRTMKRIENA